MGENSILSNAKDSKELTIKQSIKEEIEESILEIQIEEATSTGNITLKKLYEELPKRNANIAFEEYDSTQLSGTYTKDGKIYTFTIDENFNVTIGEQGEPQPLSFEEIQWTNGKASISITSKISNSIEYQVNATSEENWIQGSTVTNLNNGDIVYARINDGTTITKVQQKEIKDEIEPEEFEITVPEDKITSKSINVSTTGTTDNQTGLATYSYIATTSTSQMVKEITGQTVTEYTIDDLDSDTEYVVYMLAYDNAGNVRKSNEVVVKTLEPPKIEASDIDASYYGKTVSNYNCENSEAVDEWQILYADNKNIYLIAKHCIKNIYAPDGRYGSEIISASDNEYEVSLKNVINDYTGSEDIIQNNMCAWLSWANTYKTSTAYGIRAVAYLLDINIWDKFKGEYAEYAVGAPTGELICESIREYGNYAEHLSSWKNYRLVGNYAYGQSFYHGDLGTHDYTQNLFNNCGNDFWLASPSGYDKKVWIMYVNKVR